MRIRPWRPCRALNVILLLALSIPVLAPVSGAPAVAATQTLSVDGSDPAATDTTCAPCKTIQGALNLAGPGAGITVAPGTYPETLTITQSVSITGGVPLRPGEQGPTIVDAGGTGSVVTIPNVVPPDVLVSLTSLTLTDGKPPTAGLTLTQGGGIAALGGTLSLSGTTIMSNTAIIGGGIYASNALTLTNSPIMSNTGYDPYYPSLAAAGIYAGTAVTVMLTNSPVMSNTGRGIVAGNALTLTNSPVMNNAGAAIVGGPVALTDSPVISNAGGIDGNGATTLTDSPVISNAGTGSGVSGGAVMLTNSPVISNTGYNGGGIDATDAVTLTDSPVISNSATNDGGGIWALGRVMLTDSPVISNTATEHGGGISARYGPVTLAGSPVMSNTAIYGNGGGITGPTVTLMGSPVSANTARGGGGIFGGTADAGGGIADGVVTLTDSPVMNNTGAAIVGNAVTLTDSPVISNAGGGIVGSCCGPVTLTDSPVLSNTATYGDGGGIHAAGSLALTDSPVSENTAIDGGGIDALGPVTLTDSPVSENTATDSGGGLDAQGTVATLLSSAVLSNTARSGNGGGILNSGSLRITNSTLSANSAATNGGAIDSTGSLTLSFSTVSANSALNGGGIAMPWSGPATLKATILAGNTASSGADCAGYVTSLGDNIIGDADGCHGFSAPGDLTGSGDSPLDPGLDALADNGGPTLTQALLPGSPAINHVPAARCTDASGTPVTSDQSGVARPDPGDLSGACDSGAYEYDGGPVILGVAPSSGPLAGGTQVVISGTDLEGTGPVSVTFGGIAATNVITDPSGQLITATTPARAAGTIDVAVAALVETSVITTPVTPDDQFTYGVPSTPTSTSRPASTATSTAQPTPTPTSAPIATNTPHPASTSTKTTSATSTPRLVLVPTSAHVGGRVLVAGSGFGPNELVTLALNGEALAPTPIRTSGHGSFTATFVAPDSLLTGANTLSAVGATSGRMALATVLGRRRTQTYYLAGGVESSTEHAALDLLNPNAQRAHVGYTLYSQTGDTTRGTLTVGAHAARVVPVAGLTSLRGSFGLALSTDRPLAAQLTLTRKGRDGDTILATPGTARRWYLAAGETGRTFHESVAILNPDRTRPAQVRLQLLPSGGGRSRTVTLRVRPHTQVIEGITPLLPEQSLSIIAEASRPVVVERRLTFSRDGHGHDYGLTTRLGTTTPAQLWLLAPGMPLPHLQTSLALLNPTTRRAHVTARFYGRSGRLVSSQTIRLNGPGRAEITLPSVGPARGAAGVVTSDQPLVVERLAYSGSPNGLRTAGSDVVGRNGVAPRWSFPMGDTRPGQREVLLLANPSVATVHVVVTLYGSDGRTVQQHVTLPPHGQATLDVGRSFPGATGVHGVRVTSTNGDGFLAEQTVFGASGSTVQRTEGLAQ